LFPGKLRSKWEGSYTIEEAYPSGAIKLESKGAIPWIVNGQRLKHYRVDEPKVVETLYTITIEEFLSSRYGRSDFSTAATESPA